MGFVGHLVLTHLYTVGDMAFQVKFLTLTIPAKSEPSSSADSQPKAFHHVMRLPSGPRVWITSACRALFQEYLTWHLPFAHISNPRYPQEVPSITFSDRRTDCSFPTGEQNKAHGFSIYKVNKRRKLTHQSIYF